MQKWKDWMAIAVILLLFPYIVVVFLGNGEAAEDIAVNYEGNYYIQMDHGSSTEYMDLESYVLGAASSVLWKDCAPEMMKAQVILVRTNVVRELKASCEGRTADNRIVGAAASLTEVYTEPAQLKARMREDFEPFYACLSEAAAQTQGMILTFEGEPAEAAYHFVSSGRTRSGARLLGEGYPYLQPADSSADLASEDYLFRKEISDTQWKKILTEAGYAPDASVKVTERDDSGYVNYVQIGETELSGEAFRELFDLNSADFTIESGKNGRIVTTKGVGHGLGMSQYGANALAEQGLGFEEIISCYFHGTELQKIE